MHKYESKYEYESVAATILDSLGGHFLRGTHLFHAGLITCPLGQAQPTLQILGQGTNGC